MEKSEGRRARAIYSRGARAMAWARPTVNTVHALCHVQHGRWVAGIRRLWGLKLLGINCLAAIEPFKSEVRGQGTDLALCHGARVRGRQQSQGEVLDSPDLLGRSWTSRISQGRGGPEEVWLSRRGPEEVLNGLDETQGGPGRLGSPREVFANRGWSCAGEV